MGRARIESWINQHSQRRRHIKDPAGGVFVLVQLEQVFVYDGWEESGIAFGKVFVDVLIRKIAAEEDGFDGMSVVLLSQLGQGSSLFSPLEHLE